MSELVPISWPKSGLVQNDALSAQSPGTTTDCLNVRNYDVYDRRNRGGQRSGISKYIEDAVNGTSDIQGLYSAVKAFDPDLVVPDQTIEEVDTDDQFSVGQEVQSDADWNEVATDASSPSGFDTDVAATSGTITAESHLGDVYWRQADGVSPGNGFPSHLIYFAPDLTPNYTIEFVLDPPDCSGTAANRGAFGVVMRFQTSGVPHDEQDYVGIGWVADTASAGTAYTPTIKHNTQGSNTSPWQGNGTTIGTGPSMTHGTPINVLISVNGDSFAIFINGVQVGSAFTASANASEVGTGFVLVSGDTGDQGPGVRDITISSAVIPASFRETKLIATSGGNIYVGNPDDGLAVATGGTAAVQAQDHKRTGMTAAFQFVYFADGDPGSYVRLNLASDTVTDWGESVTDGVLPVGSTDTAYNITAVDTGDDKLTVAEDLSAVIAVDDYIVVNGSTGNDGAYQVSAVTGTGPTVFTLRQDVTDATVDGTLARANRACRLIATYRGRVVLSGLGTDPQNWFMSKSGDPLDWDYDPATTSAIQAVAGNNTDLGLVGDVVTALCPYQDDVMIMGGANSIWIMRGDPAAGGSIDNITREVGIVGANAWCWDPAGNFYFFGQNGLYRMTGGLGVPELISRNKLDKKFSDVDFEANHVILSYDSRDQGIHVFISPQLEPDTAGEHYFWDERNDAFWLDKYPASVGPTAVHSYKGDKAEENGVLLGGYDSVIRVFDEDAKDDDGTLIDSFIRFTPLTPGDIFGSSIVDDWHFLLDQQSDDVTVKLWSGDTVEEAERLADAEGTPVFKKTLTGGRNSTIRRRRSDNAFIMELAQNGTEAAGSATWAYEGGGAKVKVLTRMKGRHVS